MEGRSQRNRLRQFAHQEREVVLAFAGTRLLVCLIAVFAFYSFKHGEHQVLPSARPWNLLYHWDALWYGRIVHRGYEYTPGQQSSVNFFPLYPLTVRGFRALTGTWTPFAGFVISNAALLGAGILLRRLAALDYPSPSRVPHRAVWFLFLCPATFFHSAAYAESLFLFLSLGAVLLARHNRWAGSGAAGALLTATRGNALLILVPLMWEAVATPRRASPNESKAQRIWRSRAWLGIVPTGLLVYAGYLYARFGDALAFGHSQRLFFRELAWPWLGFLPACSELFPNGALQLAAVGAGLFFCWLAYRVRLRMGYQLYAAATLLLCTSSAYWTGLPRYLGEIFPFFLALAAATIQSKALYLLALAASAGVMAYCLALFVCGYVML